MIKYFEEIPITEESYPFSSAERYCRISEKGYTEKEYYMYGTANVYQTMPDGTIEVKNPDVNYVNRIIVRAPQKPEECSGNVVVEIINATSLMEIERMWILAWRQFVRNGDIYVGITSKHATLPKLKEFDEKRYGKLSWPNPTPDVPFPYTKEDVLNSENVLPDQDIQCEPGLFWDMLSDLPEFLKRNSEENPLYAYHPKYVALTGWSQSGAYMIRYINDFVYREPEKGDIYDGFLLAGPPRSFRAPANQYEALMPYDSSMMRVKYVRNPMIVLQTESENGGMNACNVKRCEGDSPDFLCRQYDVTGASHDTVYSYVEYYQNDPDLIRIDHLPYYAGKDAVANDYPSYFLFGAAYRNLFQWISSGTAPAHCDLIEMTTDGVNKRDALGVTKGGLRTCLLDYPTGRYFGYSACEKGANAIFPNSEIEPLFGHEEPYSAEMLKAMYQSLDHYRELVTEHTKEQISKGFIVKEDLEPLVEFAVNLAKQRGLE